MENIVVELKTEGPFRASGTIPELRIAAEALYAPMRVVGMWEYGTGMHLCPQEERLQPCPHLLDEEDSRYEAYTLTLQRQRHANLALSFPHAGMILYLA